MAICNKLSYFFYLSFLGLIVISCNKKTETTAEQKPENAISVTNAKNLVSVKDSISGTYNSKTEDCNISLIISKNQKDYHYIFTTKNRTLKGKAIFSQNSSGEKFISLEGIKWDEYEGDISNEENDSIPAKELKIPVGIDALYVKDTLTIQNYGNAMNSYTKISECGLKYIQLIKK